MGPVLKLQVSHTPLFLLFRWRGTYLLEIHSLLLCTLRWPLSQLFADTKICYCRAAQTQWPDTIFSVLCKILMAVESISNKHFRTWWFGKCKCYRHSIDLFDLYIYSILIPFFLHLLFLTSFRPAK
jgi:hypothetical protein